MGGEHSALDSDNVHIKGALHKFTCWLMVNKLGLLSPMEARTLEPPLQRWRGLKEREGLEADAEVVLFLLDR